MVESDLDGERPSPDDEAPKPFDLDTLRRLVEEPAPTKRPANFRARGLRFRWGP
jgi:hypothetical protein